MQKVANKYECPQTSGKGYCFKSMERKVFLHFLFAGNVGDVVQQEACAGKKLRLL